MNQYFYQEKTIAMSSNDNSSSHYIELTGKIKVPSFTIDTLSTVHIMAFLFLLNFIISSKTPFFVFFAILLHFLGNSQHII